MKTVFAHLVIGIVIILAITATGCVAPPQGATPGAGTSYNPGEGSAATSPTTQNLVSEVTPFVTGVQTNQENQVKGQGYNTFATSTPIQADQSCLIYFNKQYSALSNTTAISFDLKNPPMYINYTVIPFNITVNKVFSSRSGGGNMETLTYSDYAPYSWFEITVRNKTSGEIYQQDGFGREKGYGIYTSATLKVLKRDNMLIEFHGNNITAAYGVWVKPVGNVDDPQNKTYSECKYWEGLQNKLTTPTATATPTWTPENVVTKTY
jgi:hypothetical protein